MLIPLLTPISRYVRGEARVQLFEELVATHGAEGITGQAARTGGSHGWRARRYSKPQPSDP